MAVSVTSRPNTWSAIKNPTVYKFTSTGHGALANYRIEVEVFKASDNTSLTSGVKFSFSPDSSGISYADVSTIIKAYLRAEWSDPSVLNTKETDTSLKFYIKYQELYDGSATAVQDDVANPRYAVFAGLQIPSTNGNDLTDYVPGSSSKQFLTLFDRPKLWRGYPATLSYIHPDALILFVYRSQFDSSGAELSSEYEELEDDNDDSVNRLDLFSGFALNALAKTFKVKLAAATVGAEQLTNGDFSSGSLIPNWTIEAGAGTNWVYDTVEDKVENDLAGGGAESDNIAHSIGATLAAGWYQIAFETEGQAGTIDIILEAYNSGVLVSQFYNDGIMGASLHVNTIRVNIPGAFDTIKIRGRFDEVGSPILELHSLSVKPLTFADYTEELTYDVEDPCNNPVLVVWKNSLGGDAWWMFDYNQEKEYVMSSVKAKRLRLSDNYVTDNQWEALNELNHIGQVYKQNIQEFTSSINKSHLRDGTQVYVVDASGNKTGVIVIPARNMTNTKRVRHIFEVEIEYPERIE